MAETTGGSDHFPEHGLPFRGAVEVRHERFARLRESLMFDLAEADAATATLMAYWGDLEDLLWWCLHEEVDVLAPTTADVERYLEALRVAGYSPNTVARRVTALRRFYAHLVELGESETSPLHGIHRRRPRPRARPPVTPRLTARQRRRMLDSARDARDRAVLALLFAGIPVAQVCRAVVGDLRPGPPAVLVATHRGIPETVEVGEEAAAAVRAYLAGRETGPLVVDREGRAVDRFDLNRLLARVARQAGIRSPVGPSRLPQRASRNARASIQRSPTDR
ncbi:site-specific integrase [Actinosynnema sp. NPDC020468]|uniref:tyrosine-type recombinase/integrase n=1 Tax=Actinosynnema sp. NPDC020468 TaxID=3154488 RepID=UPI0033C4A3F2